MRKLIILAFIGFCAQLVDGSLGMAYGVTSTSLLLMSGIAPAVASASVHMAEVVTTAASGLSHIRFGNVDKQVVRRLIVPGAIGAFLGACFLSNIPGDLIKPFISVFLLLLGIHVLYRFVFKNERFQKNSRKKFAKKHFIPLGFAAGFFDATGGGGWGPITTPILMAGNKMEPRKVIGSVDTSEFVIAVSSTIGFLLTLGWEQIHVQWVLALMAGGIIAAPVAAWLVKIIPAKLLGTLVGGIIIVTNTRTLLEIFNVPVTWTAAIYIFLFLLWAAAVVYTIMKLKNNKPGLPGNGTP